MNQNDAKEMLQVVKIVVLMVIGMVMWLYPIVYFDRAHQMMWSIVAGAWPFVAGILYLVYKAYKDNILRFFINGGSLISRFWRPK